VSDWELDCIHWHGEILTGDFRHWCNDWDDLPIDESCSEFACCCCDFRERNTLAEVHRARLDAEYEAERAKHPEWTDFDAFLSFDSEGRYLEAEE
jgi:hypothetical protein